MIDSLILGVDRFLRTLFVEAPTARSTPARDVAEAGLADDERAHAAALMRVNHVGEVCAQALYQGQALTCGDATIRLALARAADEEVEHLAWTAQRIEQLGGRKSVLNPLWYLGAFAIGAAAGKCGDRWSLGFLAETERQVEAHLSGHLTALPVRDAKSRAVVEQMRADEVEHAEMATRLGARDLPAGVKVAMRLSAGVMTRVVYYV